MMGNWTILSATIFMVVFIFGILVVPCWLASLEDENIKRLRHKADRLKEE